MGETFQAIDCTANGGRRYRVLFDAQGNARSVASMIWRDGARAGRGTCNSPAAGERPRIFWRAGQAQSATAACAIRAALKVAGRL